MLWHREKDHWEIFLTADAEKINMLDAMIRYSFEKFQAKIPHPHNPNEGGSGLPSPSEETRMKLIKKHSGRNSPFYGKHHSEETREKMSEAKRGENNPMFGKHPTEETRKMMSTAKRGRTHPFYGKHHSEETREKMSEAKRGENNPMFGNHHSKETKRKMSEARAKRNKGIPQNISVKRRGLSKMDKEEISS